MGFSVREVPQKAFSDLRRGLTTSIFPSVLAQTPPLPVYTKTRFFAIVRA